MFTSLLNANIKVSSWLLKQSRMYVLLIQRYEEWNCILWREKEVVLTYRWLFQAGEQSNGYRTWWGFMGSGPQGKRFVHKYKFSWDVELHFIMDFKYLSLWSVLFYVYLWNLLLTLAKWITIVSVTYLILPDCYKPFWYLSTKLPKELDF